MFFGDIDAQQWVPVREWHDEGVEHAVAMVLTATGSLTRFVTRHFGLELTVKLHDQFVDPATNTEADILDYHGSEPVLRRQVSLRSHNRVMFDAESVLPLDGVPAELMAQLESGDKPLGNLLMDRGVSLSRSDLSVTKFQVADEEWHWARRSVLRSGSGTRALVVEFFYPALWRHLTRQVSHS
ncbi:MAG: chorismate lyase [Mariprofundales bacterium]